MGVKPTYEELLIENECLKKKLSEKNDSSISIKESEEQFRTIFHSANAAIAITDGSGKFIKCNELWEKMFGYNNEELKNLTNIDITHPDDVALTRDYTADLINGKIDNLRIEKRYITKDKSILWVDLSITYLKINDILNFYGVAIDISDKKNTEFKIQQQNIELQNLIVTKDKFISILAHDLRNPFNSLIYFSDLLKVNLQKYELTEIKKYIDIINETSINTYNLLENLLMWAASQLKIIPFNPLPYNLFLLANECSSFVYNDSVFKNINIKNEIAEDVIVFADSEMVKTILRNLLTNAIKFTPFSGKIVLSAKLNQTIVEIIVSDTGVGMNEITKNTIFKIGETKSKNGTNNEHGTGFRLLLCKEFVEKQGGKIWAESELGKGSDFKFTLPLYND